MMLGTAARGQESNPHSGSIKRALDYLRGSVSNINPGESGLVALALIKAHVPPDDSSLRTCLTQALSRFQGTTYVPTKNNGTETYEGAVIGMALANLDPVGYKPHIESIAKFLLSRQQSSGCWDYDNRTAGDASISQYALLGLWEAENVGVSIPAKVWDTGASWYLNNQNPSGAWNYHPDEKGTYGDTISMTAAGVGSLLLCKRQLVRYRKVTSDGPSAYLVPLVSDPNAVGHVDVRTSNASIDNSVKRGIAWLNGHMNAADAAIVGPSPCYSMYGIERVSALASADNAGGKDLFDRALQRIVATQGTGGNWTGGFGDSCNTAWAILLLTKSTTQTVVKLNIQQRYKGGTLLGGRGLPDNVENLTIAQGRVIVRPMNGAVEQMLSVLADPRALNAESALEGLIDKYRSEGPKAVRPYKDKLRKLLTDRDPGVRRVACWGLGRTGDLDVVPDLVEVLLREPDDAVLGEAKIGLQVLSRKVSGYGPPPSATPEERQQAAKQWRSWYDLVRPPDRSDADEEGN
jgi:hypothetical protein